MTPVPPEDEVRGNEDERPEARLSGESARPRESRKPGSAVGVLVVVEEDDEHLEDFKDYMP